VASQVRNATPQASDFGLDRTTIHRWRTRLLEDEEWREWSDREIARQCKVSHPSVGKIRSEITQVVTGTITGDNNSRTYTTKHGTKAKMNITGLKANGDAGSAAQEAVASRHLRPCSDIQTCHLPNSNSFPPVPAPALCYPFFVII
jgi:hypothetical protein